MGDDDPMAGCLTTHVLDTSTGKPGRGIRIELFHLNGTDRLRLADVVTNDDGRCDAPILDGEAFTVGVYELMFHAGNYFDSVVTVDSAGISRAEILFLDHIPIRFGISDAQAHYHVPLLLSPFGYSTYRGS